MTLLAWFYFILSGAAVTAVLSTILVRLDRRSRANPAEFDFWLTDHSDSKNKRRLKVHAVVGSNGVEFQPDGYGEDTAFPGEGSPIFMEYYEGDLRVLCWPDINHHEPTIISMAGALEEKRNEDPDGV
jgi:hypothetical protein